jgi:hypothetical protein
VQLENQSASTRRELLRWLEVEQAKTLNTPEITSDIIEEASRRRTTPIAKMADNLLAHCARNSRTLGEMFALDNLAVMKSAEALSYAELRLLVEYLAELGYVHYIGGTSSFRITAQGHARVESGAATSIDSTQAFVAMWFAPALNEVFETGLRAAISRSGYAAFRIDRKEHANKIDDEIIAEIRKSRFLVADFTGHRGGVYFEAGFAQGIGIPVIWTCREDALTELHFDIRQYNCVTWKSSAELATALERRIVALIGQGPLAPE